MVDEVKLEVCSSLEKGSLGVCHVKRFWEKSARITKGVSFDKKYEWNLDLIIIDKLNLGIEEAIQKVFEFTFSFEKFEKWILDKNGGSISPDRINEINSLIIRSINRQKDDQTIQGLKTASPLNGDAMKFWNDNGYIILKEAVSKEECLAAEKAVWEFLEMDSSNPRTWYKSHPKRQGIMVQLFDHPALAATRENALIRNAFEQLWGNSNLIVSHDRVSFNPPENSEWQFPGPGMHWDTSIALPIPLGLQGLLYLTDTEAEQGAFTCVPGFHNKIEDWLQNLEQGTDPRAQDFEKLGAVPIAAERGDFVLWHHALPHGSRPNKMERPRIVQYIKWYPPDYKDIRKWI